LITHVIATYQSVITVYGTAMALGPAWQAVKIVRARSARDVSLFSAVLIGVGCGLWLGWGLFVHDLPLIVANSVALLAYFAVVSAILVFTRRAA
jgi:uncharacterized protein with PQ loop repeat